MKRFTAKAALVIAAVGAATLIGSAGAQQVNEVELRKAFAIADVNGDGYIDVNEYVAQVIYIFRQIDVNKDGSITVQEWAAYNPGYSPERFKSADRNGDGKISLGEAVGAKMIEFFDIDTNRDGAISVEELIVYERSLPAKK